MISQRTDLNALSADRQRRRFGSMPDLVVVQSGENLDTCQVRFMQRNGALVGQFYLNRRLYNTQYDVDQIEINRQVTRRRRSSLPNELPPINRERFRLFVQRYQLSTQTPYQTQLNRLLQFTDMENVWSINNLPPPIYDNAFVESIESTLPPTYDSALINKQQVMTQASTRQYQNSRYDHFYASSALTQLESQRQQQQQEPSQVDLPQPQYDRSMIEQFRVPDYIIWQDVESDQNNSYSIYDDSGTVSTTSLSSDSDSN